MIRRFNYKFLLTVFSIAILVFVGAGFPVGLFHSFGLVVAQSQTHIYLAQWEWITEEGQSFWQCPGGDCSGTLDLRTIPEMSIAGGIPQGYGIFTYSSQQTIPAATYLGTDLNSTLSSQQKANIKAKFKITMTSQTPLDVMWDMLTKYSDPTGQTAPKPLMPNLKNELSIHFNNQKVRTETFDILTHPHKDKVISLIQQDYRKIRDESLSASIGSNERDTYKRVLDYWKDRYRVDYRLFIPSDLPDEGILPHKTVLKDDFNKKLIDKEGVKQIRELEERMFEGHEHPSKDNHGT